jgi:hypothetical protein
VPAHLDIAGNANQSGTSALDGEAVTDVECGGVVAGDSAEVGKASAAAKNALNVFSSRRNTGCSAVKDQRARSGAAQRPAFSSSACMKAGVIEPAKVGNHVGWRRSLRLVRLDPIFAGRASA